MANGCQGVVAAFTSSLRGQTERRPDTFLCCEHEIRPQKAELAGTAPRRSAAREMFRRSRIPPALRPLRPTEQGPRNSFSSREADLTRSRILPGLQTLPL